MKTITAYKLSDGSIVECEKEAIETEKVLSFKNELYKFASRVYVRIDDEDDFAHFMDSHGKEIYEILDKKFGGSKKLTIFTSSNEPTK